MLRRIPLVLMLLQFVPAGARSEAPPAESRLEILQQTRWVRSAEALHEACGRRDPIRACTHLSAELLPGPCAPETGSWRMSSPRIRLTVVRVFVGPSRRPFNELTVQHEASHIAHFREGLDEYLDELVVRRFSSQRGCIDAGEMVIRDFSDRMRQIERASNRKLHAQRPASTSPDKRP